MAQMAASKDRGKSKPLIEVVHYADPWCWYSWGLEPVLQRLQEVYGENLEITFLMGGVFDNMKEWLEHYGIEDNKALIEWIQENDKLMRNPFNVEYLLQSGVKTTLTACIAVKTAELYHGKETAERFYRKLLEAALVRAQNISSKEVLEKLALESGFDAREFIKKLGDKKSQDNFNKDRRKMEAEKGNYYSLSIANRLTGKRQVVAGYTSENYEKAIEELTDNQLPKKTPIDILEHLDRRRDSLISAREIAEVFKISQEEAERRLNGLSKTGALERVTVEKAGVYWQLPMNLHLPKLTIEQVTLSHVTASAQVTEGVKLEEVVTSAVQKLYSEVASQPEKGFHFPVGRSAASFVGYPQEELDKIPQRAAESFAGVGYPHITNSINKGDTVLDVGSGSGTDIFVSALRTGTEGKVIGLDFTDPMIAKAIRNIGESNFANIRIVKGDATRIPVDDNSVDVVTSNGVLNLVPNKQKAFREIFRILGPGGRLQFADIVVHEDVQAVCGLVPQLWADCIGGAVSEKNYFEMLKNAGFEDVRVSNRLDYFSKAASENIRRLANTFGAESVVISAMKPTRESR
ncbi:MAG: methyltransferase domain-containing protein [Thaumarchaeota archaeon]|nr:methyltransferase domain-containing protein [Nitrososphaerota archaeon]